MTLRIAHKTLRRPLEHQRPHLRERALTKLLGPPKSSGCRGVVHIAGRCACFGAELALCSDGVIRLDWSPVKDEQAEGGEHQ